MKRQPSRPGLSYADANRGRLISYGPDVMDIKAEIETRWPGVIEVWFDTYQDEWIVVEKCTDGIDRHVMSTKRLDQKVIDKLQRIDQAAHAVGDVNAKLEREDAEAEKQAEYQLSETVGEGVERLLTALRKDGLGGRPTVFFPSRSKAA